MSDLPPCETDSFDRCFERAIGSPTTWRIVAAVAAVTLILSGLSCYAQEHKHPPQDQAIHERFYSTWMMPDNRSASCCHNEDCSPAESRFEDGHWVARKLGDLGDFTPVPREKVERDRDSPDGRSHLCGRRYSFEGGRLIVFCFIPGGGA